MKDPGGFIRTWLYTALYQQVSYEGSYVPVYVIPPESETMPYIVISEQDAGAEMGAKNSWVLRHSATVDIYQSFTGTGASYIPVNTICDTVMEILRTRTQPSDLTGFNCISHTIDSVFTDRMIWENNIVVMKVINISFLIEES